MSVNTTSKVLVSINPDTGQKGVKLPDSNRVLSGPELDSRIQTVRAQINHFTSAQSNRTTHGGKKHRSRQATLREQADSASKTLALLLSAKAVLAKQNKPEPTLQQILIEKSIPMLELEGYYILERSPYAAIFAQRI